MENQPEPMSGSSAIPWKQSSKSKTIAATGLFAALAIILTSISQFPIFSFPLIPYLQFDLGEVAIVLALLLFGPVPAITAAFVEFITLMGFGVNAPFGPILKLIAILSSIFGLWLGVEVAGKAPGKTPSRRTILGSSLGLGLISRAGILTVANYFLIILVPAYAINGIIYYVKAPLESVGISITSSNAFFVILSLTAVFNVLQLLLVFSISYFVVKEPHVGRTLRSNGMAWFESIGRRIAPL